MNSEQPSNPIENTLASILQAIERMEQRLDRIEQKLDDRTHERSQGRRRYLTPADYAADTGLGRQTIYALLKAGRIEGATWTGSRWLIPIGAEIAPPLQTAFPIKIQSSARALATWDDRD